MEENGKTYVFDSGRGSDNLVTGMLMGAGLGSPFGGWGAAASGFGGLGGFGFGNTITDLIGLAIVASIFGWGGNGFGFNGGNGNAGAAGFLSNQISDTSTRDLVLQAIQGTDADVRQLASTWNVDVESLKTSLSNVNLAIANVGAKNDLSFMQTINAIQSGNAVLGRQLCECCCENRLLTTQQGYEAQIRTLEQTNQLGSQADRNTNSILGAINAQTIAMNAGFCEIKERELQDKIDALAAQNTVLRGQIDNANQTAAITGYVNSLIAPLQSKVDTIASKQLPTVPVVYPNITAVNTTPFYGYGYQGSIWS